MRKLAIIVVVFSFVLIWFGQEKVEQVKGRYHFEATITNVGKETQFIHVKNKSGEEIVLTLPKDSQKETYKVGQKIVIWLDGGIRETAPVQATAKHIETIITPPVDEEYEPVVKISRSGVSHLDKLDQFITEKKKKIKIIQYTIEGDPVSTRLERTEQGIKVVYDTTKDKYGPKKIQTTYCERVEKTKTNTDMVYTLKNCNGEDRELVYIDFNVGNTSGFEFALQIDDSLVNTKKNLLMYKEGEKKITVFNFFLTKEQRQQIYEKFVLENIAGNQVIAPCETGKAYRFTYWLNGKEKTYNWHDCKGNEKLTAFVNYIYEDVIQVHKK
ncbi:MAG: DUF4362 domain-containing protein [Bacillaceae bacterium]